MHVRLLLLSAALLFTSSCTPSCQKKTAQESIDKADAAAVVNGRKLSQAKLDALTERAVSQMNQTGHKVDETVKKRMRASLLKKMIDDEIMMQKATLEGIKVDRFERVEALERYKTRMGGEQGFVAFLKQRNLTEEQVLETVVEELTRSKLVEKLSAKVEVSDEEIVGHYESNAQLYTVPMMVRARQILFKLNKDDPKEKETLVLEKAKRVLAEANEEKESFAALAAKYGEGPSAQNQGDLGFFSRGRMVKAFEDAAFDAPLKTPIGPIKTDYGYHLIFVEQKTPERVATLEEVRNRISEMLSRNKESRKAENLLNNLRKHARLHIFDDSLSELDYRGKKEAEVAAKHAE